MSYCINPRCSQPKNPDDTIFCQSCGSDLLLNGQYTAIRKLGGGGFGNTFAVEAQNKFKVLKVLHLNDENAIKLFKQEAEVLSKLNHPGIPKVEENSYFVFFPKGNVEGIYCLLMEKIAGQDLQEWLNKRGKPIEQILAIKWLRQLAEILDEVHQKQFFHRDIKPANIMLRASGQLTLIDFGTVKEITATFIANQNVGKQGSVIYTPGYAPSEQENGYTVPQSDFFALGRTIVHLLTGKHPLCFYDPYIDALNWRHAAGSLTPVFADFLDELMARLFNQRPANTKILLQRLTEIEKIIAGQKNNLPTPSQENVLSLERLFDDKTINHQAIPVEQIFPEEIKTIAEYPIEKIFAPDSYLKTNSDSTIDHDKTTFGKNTRVTDVEEIWNIVHWQKIGTLNGHTYPVSSVTISPNGRILASGSADNTIKVWHLSKGELLRNFIGHIGAINALAISLDGQILVSGSADNTIKIWHLPTGKALGTLKEHGAPVTSLAITIDGKTLISASADNTIKLWQLPNGEFLGNLLGHSDIVSGVAVSLDGQLIASSSYDKTIKLWHLARKQLLKTFIGHTEAVRAIVITPNCQNIISSSDDQNILIWDTVSGEAQDILTGHVSGVITLALSADGKTLVSGSRDNTIKVWDLQQKKELATLKGHSNFILSVAITPNGKTIISGSRDTTIKIWQRQDNS